MMAVGLKLDLVRFWSSGLVEMSMFSWDFEVVSWLRFWRWNLSKLCVRTHDMTSRSYFGKMNSILGSVVPLAMFYIYVKDNTHLRYFCKKEDGNVFIFSRGYLLIGILCILNDISTKIFREKYSHDWAGNHGGGTPTWRCGKSMPKIQSKYVQPIMSKTSISTMSDVEVQTSQELQMLSRSNTYGQSLTLKIMI